MRLRALAPDAFARFLAENHLLLHPEGVPVTLDEVRELASAEKPPVEMWALAARWAARRHRVTFQEITKPAVLAAAAAPREVNRALVDAALIRTLIDRVVG